jgi:pimeloyl-ACP methyl ester carboxylesterase
VSGTHTQPTSGLTLISDQVIELCGDGLVLAATRFTREDECGTVPDVVLVPGGGQTRHTWRRVATTLARRGWNPVSVDLRGHGDSGWADDGDYSLDAYARDIAQVVRGLGTRPALIGASVGGLASMVALADPDPAACDIASALALLDVTPRLSTDGISEIGEFMRHNMAGFVSLEDAADALAGRGRRRPDPGRLQHTMRRRGGRWYWHWDPRIADHIHDTPGAVEAEQRYEHAIAAAARVRVPTLIARGEHSTVVSQEAADELAATMLHPEPVNLPGVGHMFAGDDNDPFTGVLIDFLSRRHPPAGSSRS